MWKRLCLESCLCNCENGKYLASLMDKIICDESIDIKDKSFNNKNNKDNL